MIWIFLSLRILCKIKRIEIWIFIDLIAWNYYYNRPRIFMRKNNKRRSLIPSQSSNASNYSINKIFIPTYALKFLSENEFNSLLCAIKTRRLQINLFRSCYLSRDNYRTLKFTWRGICSSRLHRAIPSALKREGACDWTCQCDKETKREVWDARLRGVCFVIHGRYGIGTIGKNRPASESRLKVHAPAASFRLVGDISRRCDVHFTSHARRQDSVVWHDRAGVYYRVSGAFH